MDYFSLAKQSTTHQYLRKICQAHWIWFAMQITWKWFHVNKHVVGISFVLLSHGKKLPYLQNRFRCMFHPIKRKSKIVGKDLSLPKFCLRYMLYGHSSTYIDPSRDCSAWRHGNESDHNSWWQVMVWSVGTRCLTFHCLPTWRLVNVT